MARNGHSPLVNYDALPGNLLARERIQDGRLDKLERRTMVTTASFPAYFVADYGGDIQQAINAAAAGSAAGGLVVADSRVYELAAGLVVAAGVTLYLPQGCSLNPTGDIHVVTMRRNARLKGEGSIDLTLVANYTKAAVFLDGTDLHDVEDNTTIEGIKIFNDDYKGTGIYLYSGNTANYRVQMVRVMNVVIAKMEYGLRLQAVQPATGESWVNGNAFTGVSLIRCKYMIDLDGDPAAVGNNVRCNGNTFTGLQIQPDSSTVRVLTVHGHFNQFVGIYCWDLTLAAVTDLFVFSDQSGANYLATDAPYDRLRDWGSNTIHNVHHAAPTQYLHVPPLGATTAPSGLGLMDDILALADVLYTVIRSGPTPVAGSTASLFDLTPATVLQYDSLIDTTAVVIEIDFGVLLDYLFLVGVHFAFDRPADEVKIERYDGAAWVTLIDVTGFKGTRIFVNADDQYDRPDFATAASKLKFTFKKVVTTNVQIERLWAYASDRSGAAYLKSVGGKLYGNLDANNKAVANALLNTGSAATTLTIATGIITAAGRMIYKVDTEAAAATDDLDTISGGVAGDMLILMAANDARTVVVKHATGNILLHGAADFSLDHTADKQLLWFDGSNWLGLAPGSNNGT